VRYSV
jgi:hypothetical protein